MNENVVDLRPGKFINVVQAEKILSTFIFEDKLYVATDLGVFCKRKNSDEFDQIFPILKMAKLTEKP